MAVILAALASGITPYLSAERYQVFVATSATTILLSTSVSAITLSVLVLWLVPGRFP